MAPGSDSMSIDWTGSPSIRLHQLVGGWAEFVGAWELLTWWWCENKRNQ